MALTSRRAAPSRLPCALPAWEYRFLPVSGGYQTPEQIAAMAELLQQLPKPVLMFCRSGARSTNLYAQACLLG